MMPCQMSIGVSDASQVGEVRRAATRAADAAGLDETRRGEVAIVATELANNLVRYGRDGRVLLQVISTAGGVHVEIIALDAGPGMQNVQRCLQDGFSTGGTPGTGLGAVRRLSTEFDIYSAPGSGTVVLSRVAARPPAAAAGPRPRASFQWAALSLPAPNESVCGDAWRVVERDNEIAVMLADGLGHGPFAAEAAEHAARVFQEHPFAEPRTFIENAHRAISGTRGAAVAAASSSSSLPARTLRYAGVGNIAGTVLSAAAYGRGLVSHNGTVGAQVRKVQQLDYPWPDGSLLIMHSDGLQGRWGVEKYPGLLARHPAVIAAVLYRDFVRGRDDVTVSVVRANHTST
jgi:anti-sigma regulatory factor (Ser/Thr protein kinase)